MIRSIFIENFKSVVDLSLGLGTFNVLIGENGCGKSNILEAIAFGAATSADRLDYEFMGSRGIRLTNPEFMYSAFAKTGKKKKQQSIKISFTTERSLHMYEILNDLNNPKKWIDKNREEWKKTIEKSFSTSNNDSDENNVQHSMAQAIASHNTIETNTSNLTFNNLYSNPKFSSFIIYSPEESRLRKLEDSDHIYPLGIKGEGLFQYLKELTLNKKNEAAVQEIKDTLTLLDWYKDFDLQDNLMRYEFALSIQDKYLDERLRYFDQRSTNEGFLFLLFYATLFISDLTPTFFAIDNIEASFNPKLCTELISTLVQLAKKHNKQVIVTTHNPAVLDGLDLQDDSQRLFVVRRNDEGHTRARRIEHKPERTMKLSEIWTSGFIGGLPDNF